MIFTCSLRLIRFGHVTLELIFSVSFAKYFQRTPSHLIIRHKKPLIMLKKSHCHHNALFTVLHISLNCMIFTVHYTKAKASVGKKEIRPDCYVNLDTHISLWDFILWNSKTWRSQKRTGTSFEITQHFFLLGVLNRRTF